MTQTPHHPDAPSLAECAAEELAIATRIAKTKPAIVKLAPWADPITGEEAIRAAVSHAAELLLREFYTRECPDCGLRYDQRHGCCDV